MPTDLWAWPDVDLRKRIGARPRASVPAGTHSDLPPPCHPRYHPPNPATSYVPVARSTRTARAIGSGHPTKRTPAPQTPPPDAHSAPATRDPAAPRTGVRPARRRIPPAPRPDRRRAATRPPRAPPALPPTPPAPRRRSSPRSPAPPPGPARRSATRAP